MANVDVVVAGAGVVGLACAAAFTRRGRSVVILEAGGRIGEGVSARNSGVIHAGLHYPTGGLKHRLCVSGRLQLYAYARARGVAHRKCGKLIVAADDADLPRLAALHDRALANSVEGVHILDGAGARRLEPALACAAALVSPETGIIDAAGLMLALRGEAEDAGGAIAFRTPLERARQIPGGFRIEAGGTAVDAARLVNAAGLRAPGIARRIDGLDPRFIPVQHLAKGSYFIHRGRPAFSRLIYPTPEPGGLGVHLTLDLGGAMRFGPDVEWLDHADPDRVDHRVDPARLAGFQKAVRRYWPDLPDGALEPDYAGCRPKLAGPGEPDADFRIDGAETHGLEGLVNLFGIESPGLTSALAIADEVAARLEG